MPARTPAAPSTSSPPSSVWPFAKFVFPALVTAALDSLLVVLVTKLLPVRVLVGELVVAVPVNIPDNVVRPTESIDAV